MAAAGFDVVIGYALLRLACDLPSPVQYLWRLVTPFGRAPIEIDLALLVTVLIPLWLRKQKGLRLKLVAPSIIVVLGFFLGDWDLSPLMFWPTIFLAGYVFSEVCVAPKKFVSSSFHSLALIAVVDSRSGYHCRDCVTVCDLGTAPLATANMTKNGNNPPSFPHELRRM